MSNQLSTFTFENQSIRTLSINNEPWFIASDLCQSLNICNVSDALLKLDDDEKATIGLTDSQAGKGAQNISIVSESGMYTLILRCRDAVRKGSVPHRFRKWVTSEVLPQIRKTGKYESQPQQLALAEPKPAPAPKPQTYTLTFTERELQLLVWSWFVGVRSTHTFTKLYPSLEHLGSHFAANAYDLAFEYRHTLRDTQKVLARLTKEFKADHRNNWRVLHHLHHFDPDFLRASF